MKFFSQQTAFLCCEVQYLKCSGTAVYRPVFGFNGCENASILIFFLHDLLDLFLCRFLCTRPKVILLQQFPIV